MRSLINLLALVFFFDEAFPDDDTKNYIYREGLDWMSRHTVLLQFSDSVLTREHIPMKSFPGNETKTKNSDYCDQQEGPQNRDQIDWFHNYLRQIVAGGETFMSRKFEQQQMHGLIYDCKLEFKAAEILQHPEANLSKNYSSIEFRFPNRRKETPSGQVLEMAMITALQNEKTLHIMINPNATRFGCMGKPHTSDPRLLCIYDSKPEQQPTKIEGGLCFLDFHCTISKNATCWWGLCYALQSEVQI